jgi:hypothetical protein
LLHETARERNPEHRITGLIGAIFNLAHLNQQGFIDDLSIEILESSTLFLSRHMVQDGENFLCLR